MKKLGLCSVAAVAAFGLMLTSCLGDTKNEFTITSPAVVYSSAATGYKTVVETTSGPLYAKGLETYSEKTCLVVQAYVDRDSPENADAAAKGYWVGSLQGKPSEVDRYYAISIMSDTSTMMTNELPINKAIEPQLANAYLTYLQGCLFLPISFVGAPDEKLKWEMSYNPELKAEEESGKRVYSLFLRRIRVTEGSKKDENRAELVAFDIQRFIDSVNEIEKGLSKTQYYLKINYIDKVNEKDPTEFSWAKIDPNFYIPFAVVDKKD